MTVDEQCELLTRGAVDVATLDELKKKLATNKPLTVKVGFDPTAPDIHLGHTVLLRKMRQFQDLGHRVIFVIGDFTGMIGDPTGRVKTRPALTRNEILENAETYKRQCFKVLDPEKTEIRFNSEWLEALGLEGFIRLAAKYNVARMLERKDFKTRYVAGVQISIHEFLYPLAQAYDSVFLKADVELGGTDQLFNLNVGRDIMPDYGLPPQVVLTTPLLEGIDGVEKMSKSLKNYIGVDEAPQSIRKKVMEISDDLLWRYYELCTSVSEQTLMEMRQRVQSGAWRAARAHLGLALQLIQEFHGEDAAREQAAQFAEEFAKFGVTSGIVEIRLPAGSRTVHLPSFIRERDFAKSNSVARQLIAQSAVDIDKITVPAGTESLDLEPGSHLLRVGKGNFARIIVE